MLDNKSPLPLYFQLKEYIENQISSNVWQPGQRIVSELELSQQFQVSRTTVRQAIGELVNEGKLVRIQGKGTFVSEINIDKQIQKITGFTQDMIARGIVPSSEILDFKVVPCPPKAAKELGINESGSAILLKRLRKGNDKTIAVESAYLPHTRFKDILSEKMESNSLYAVLEKKYDIFPSHAKQIIECIKCPSDPAGLLTLEVNSPVFLIITISFDEKNQPFEYTEGYYRGDRYKLHMNIINTKTR